MDEKLKKTLDKVLALAKQNPEFGEALREQFTPITSANSSVVAEVDGRIDQIYEYCIEKVIRNQAEEFYKNFPLQQIVSTLVEDFVRMEEFRRKDNFGDFCLALYQQIECINNKLCESSRLETITSKMWAYPAYVKYDKNKELSLSERSNNDNYSIAQLIFYGKDKKGNPQYIEKPKSALQAQYANDKIRIIVYFLGYKAMMKNSDYDSYGEITSLLNDIYLCRNMNHRGSTQRDWEMKALERILPIKSFYYFKFMGALAQYIEYIKEGFEFIPTLLKYAESLPVKEVKPKVPQLNVLGTIDLSEEYKNKKRFK